MPAQLFTSYNKSLLLFALFIVLISSYTFFDMISRIALDRGPARRVLFSAFGSIAMGTGMWALYFTGTVAAVTTPAQSYDVLVLGWTELAAVLGIAIVIAALFNTRGWIRLPLVSVLLGLHFAFVYYLGMRSLDIHLHYSTPCITAAFLLSTAGSMIALKLWTLSVQTKQLRFRMAASIALAVTLVGMHLATAAVVLHTTTGSNGRQGNLSIEANELGLWICATASVVLVMLLAGAYVDRFVVTRRATVANIWYRSLYERNSDLIIVIDRDGRIIDANPVLEKATGFRSEEVIGKRIDELIADGTRTPCIPDKPSIDGSAPQHLTFQDKNGNSVHLLVTIVPIVVQGKCHGYYAICKDITQTVSVQNELVEMKQRLESLFEESGDALCIIQPNGIIIDVNQAFERLYGWPHDELIGKEMPNVPKELQEDRHWRWKLAAQGTRIEAYETKNLDRYGNVVDVSLSLFPIRDGQGNVVAVSGSARDIRERKQFERALRDSEMKYRTIADNANDLIAIVDVSGIIRYASPSHFAVFGVDSAELEGTSAVSWIYAADVPLFTDALAHTAQTKTPCELECRVRHRNGTFASLETRGMPVLDDDGAVSKFILVSREITARKHTEELLLQSVKLSVAGQLAAGIAHEIRNPMTSIKGFVQLLQTQAPTYQNYYDIMLSELDRIQRIISEFLLLAKPQTDTAQAVDVHVLLNYVVDLIQAEAVMRNIEIFTDLAMDAGIVVRGEPDRLRQAFLNIVKNAMDAMPHGGTVYICLRPKGKSAVAVSIRDSGEGISDDQLKRIGEPFYTTKQTGTGLGLMVTQNIIRDHNGTIQFCSELGVGTEVLIELPIEICKVGQATPT
ncbi:PAS domain S-box protein [Alicyclobacillus fastidiosus]|uniref:histidine kinase n=1 Tax=Alicyclobacillus fastidiosus TaxID=392011 RepID=A0ABY6ZFS8_9BACL|nr:PAS domain S-box protein [Alicyclobacillus fastidiosus]WAH41717.1 PAS domain S-box protein [Alicyclobacillus fastidiosus]GMA63398.1 hypothetical protein GCM10025859_38380 [Alicyclobacillus fastidiosus]